MPHASQPPASLRPPVHRLHRLHRRRHHRLHLHRLHRLVRFVRLHCLHRLLFSCHLPSVTTCRHAGAPASSHSPALPDSAARDCTGCTWWGLGLRLGLGLELELGLGLGGGLGLGVGVGSGLGLGSGSNCRGRTTSTHGAQGAQKRRRSGTRRSRDTPARSPRACVAACDCPWPTSP